MAVDFRIRLTGGQSNKNPNLSLGNRNSLTFFVNNVDNNLFDDLSRLEILQEISEYRCIQILNWNLDEIYNSRIVNIEVPNNSVFEFGIIADSVNVEHVNNEKTAPIDVTFFSTAVFHELKIPLGNTIAEQWYLWIKRIQRVSNELEKELKFKIETIESKGDNDISISNKFKSLSNSIDNVRYINVEDGKFYIESSNIGEALVS